MQVDGAQALLPLANTRPTDGAVSCTVTLFDTADVLDQGSLTVAVQVTVSECMNPPLKVFAVAPGTVAPSTCHEKAVVSLSPSASISLPAWQVRIDPR